MDAYLRAAHRVQTAIATLMGREGGWSGVEPKHLRVGVDLSKSDQGGLVRLLIAKGVFTEAEYVAAVTEAATQEADQYEKTVQAVLSARNLRTR